MSNSTTTKEDSQPVFGASSCSAVAAIESLEGLARAHIAGSIALSSIARSPMDWRYNDAAAHRAESYKLCTLISEIGKQNAKDDRREASGPSSC